MFPEILKRLRTKRRLTQKQFAKEVFVSPSSISQYETGRISPSRDTLKRIADYFNVSTEYLMGTSTIAEKEEMLNGDYCCGISVSQFLAKCVKITGKDREALLTLVDALEMHSTNSNETGT